MFVDITEEKKSLEAERIYEKRGYGSAVAEGRSPGGEAKARFSGMKELGR